MLKQFFIYVLLIQLFWTGLILSFPQYYYNSLNNEQTKCVDIISGRDLSVGESIYRSGKCIRAQCSGIGPEIYEYKCNIPKFHDVGDCVELKSKYSDENYPKCCPEYECNKSVDNENYVHKRIYDHYGNLLSNSITEVFVITKFDNGKFISDKNITVIRMVKTS